MKKRQGFVSNSSSSSFVLKKEDITPLQAILIQHHGEVADWLGLGCEYPWIVHEMPMTIEGHTPMDNFSMRELFKAIGIDPHVAEWDMGGW